MPKKRRMLKKGTMENRDLKSGNGGNKRKYIRYDREVTFYEPQEGWNKINIIPYEITKKTHPLVRQGKFEVGDLDWCLPVPTHKMEDGWVLCLKEYLGKKCPVCEERIALYRAQQKEEAKAYGVKWRALLNVQPVIDGKPQPLQVWDVSTFLFTDHLRTAMKSEYKRAHGVPGEYLFADLSVEEGRTIEFDASYDVENGKKQSYFKFGQFHFHEREEALEDVLIDESISFDACIVIPTEEQVSALMYGTAADDDDDEDEDDAPVRKQRKPVQIEDDDEDEDDAPVRKQRKPVQIDDDDEDEDDAPVRKQRKPVQIEDDIVPFEQAPARKAKHAGACAHFGECDGHPECDECNTKLWTACEYARDNK